MAFPVHYFYSINFELYSKEAPREEQADIAVVGLSPLVG